MFDVHFNDGDVMYGRCELTKDGMWSRMVKDRPDTGPPMGWARCVCGRSEPVRLYSLADQSHWAGEACRLCMCIKCDEVLDAKWGRPAV